MSILDSKSLYACPTWDFTADQDEYVHGLRIIAARLKYLASRRTLRAALVGDAHATLTILDRYGIEPHRLFDETIAHIEHDLTYPSSPNVEIYVACVSKEARSLRMLKDYGSCVIRFNWMLPFVAYTYPRPFHMSMLSVVVYVPAPFNAQILLQGFGVLGMQENAFGMVQFLDRLDAKDRTSAFAVTAATLLCNLAANIKTPKFEYEQEWRLKTIRVRHPGPNFACENEGFLLRQAYGMPLDAVWNSAKTRYVQDLRLLGKFIIDDVYVDPDSGTDPVLIEALRLKLEGMRNDIVGSALDIKEELLRHRRDVQNR